MLKNLEGSRVPDVSLPIREAGTFRTVQTREFFDGKTVVVFALPGAFTPTCSSTHLPRYEQLSGTFEKHGVDAIYCISVNDPFVMEAWAKSQNAEHVKLIADGNGSFTEAMGMLVDKQNLSFGKRSWRYSMLVRDGVIEKMFIEPEVEGDPFEVSDADTMLRYLAPDAMVPQAISLISRPGCPHCARAKDALDRRGWGYEEVVLGRDVTTHSLEAISGRMTTPQVYIGGKHIGGADELEAYLEQHA